jgi:hypothetical protein
LSGLLALVVAAAHAGAAVPADGVDLVDEDDRRGVGLGLLEQVAHPAGADADEHLDEVRAGDRVERTPASPATARASSVLPVPGGPKSSTPLGIFAPTAWNLTGFCRKSLISCSSSIASSAPATSANVVFGRVLADQLGLGLAEGHDPAAAALHGVEQPEQQQQEDHERQEADQQADQDAVLRDVGGEVDALAASQPGDEVEDVVGGTRAGRRR